MVAHTSHHCQQHDALTGLIEEASLRNPYALRLRQMHATSAASMMALMISMSCSGEDFYRR
jgi:hypothetical protein